MCAVALPLCLALATTGCSATTLSQTPPPVTDEVQSIVLLWTYEDARFAAAYDPHVVGPRGFVLPSLDRDETATVVAVGYFESLDEIGFSQTTLDLERDAACLPPSPAKIWTSLVDADAAQPWAEGAWNVEQVRNTFGLSDCPAVNSCADYALVDSIELPGTVPYSTLEPYLDGFLASDRNGRFVYIDANQVATEATEFAGLPSRATAIALDGKRWFSGTNGRVVLGRDGTYEDLSIATTDTVGGLSLSPRNTRVLALSYEPAIEAPFTLRLHLFNNGRWREVATLMDPRLDKQRFTAAWDSEETAYFTYGGTKLCRLTDETVECNQDFILPGPLMVHEELGVVLAAVDNRLLYRENSGWASYASGMPFVRKPTSLLAVSDALLVGNDVGTIQQVRLDQSECPLIYTIERQIDILRENNGTIVFIGYYRAENVAVLAVIKAPDDR